MIRRALAGLRGRLLAAFVFTSAVTLAVAAAITLSPLQSRLRSESASALRTASFNQRPQFEKALNDTDGSKHSEPEQAALDEDPPNLTLAEDLRRGRRYDKLGEVAQDLRERTSAARVLVADLSFTDSTGERTPSFFYDTDFVGDQSAQLAIGFRA